MSESSDDSVDSVIAVHDHRRLKAASIASSAQITQTTHTDFPENKPVSKPPHSKEIKATSPAKPDTKSITETSAQIKAKSTTIQTSKPYLKEAQAIVIAEQETSVRYTNPQIKDSPVTTKTELAKLDSNTKSNRKSRGHRASQSVSKEEIESVLEEVGLVDLKPQEQSPCIINCKTPHNKLDTSIVNDSKGKQVKVLTSQGSGQYSSSEQPQSVKVGKLKFSDGTELTFNKPTHLNVQSKDKCTEHNAQEAKVTDSNKEKIDTHEMGNRFSSEKNKGDKDQVGKLKEKKSKNKGKEQKTKSPASDRESFVGNRSSIETIDSYSSATTLVATANAAVGRRSPKKSPRAIPPSGLKLRDVISSDDESFASVGFRTPQATTPLLKRATDPSSASQKLLEFGKNIEREITEKFTNRSPTPGNTNDQNKKATKNKQGSSEIQQTGSGAACIPDKLFSSLPKRCSKDAMIETDSDSFAMFENTERLYTSLPKDYYPIDDNLSDDVFMSCIDLAANSPDIPSRSQASRNSIKQQSSPASTKKDLLAKQQRSPPPASKHLSPQNQKAYFGHSSKPNEVPTVSDAPKGLPNHSNKPPNNQACLSTEYSHKPSEETKSHRSQKLLQMIVPRQDETFPNKSPVISKKIICGSSKSPGQSKRRTIEATTHGQTYNSTAAAQSLSTHSHETTKSINVDISKSPKTPKHSKRNGSISPASQHRVYGTGSGSPVCQKHSQLSKQVDTSQSLKTEKCPQVESSKSPTTQRRLQIDSTMSPTPPPQNQKGLRSPKTPKHQGEKVKASTTPQRPPGDSSPSPQIHRLVHVEGSVSPKISRRHQKEGSLSPGISRAKGSTSPLQRKVPEPALYCTINKPGKETRVHVVAQTTQTMNNSSSPSCARAEEESSQIQDSPKAQKQDKVLISTANKKEHLRSTYDNVPDSDDSMVYFTSKNDPVFFEDNCVSEEIIATEQTPLHYKAEEPKKLGIEIMKAPSKAKLECVFLEREKRIPVVDKEEKVPIPKPLLEPEKAQKQKTDTPSSTSSQKAIFPQTFNNSNLEQLHQSIAKSEVSRATPNSVTTEVPRTSIQVTDQAPKQDDIPPEHLTKRQIRRRNKKKNLQMVGKGNLDSGSDAPVACKPDNDSDAPLSPQILFATLQLSKSERTTDATHESIYKMKTKDKLHDYNGANNCESKIDSSKNNEPKVCIKTCDVLSQEKKDSVVITADTLLPSEVKNSSEKCDHVPPPSPSAADTLTEIAEDDEETEEVENTFIDQKAREVLVFGESVFKRLSSLVECQGDDNELDTRFRCNFDEEREEVSDDFGDQKKSCLVVLDELCDMGEQFKKETETIKSTNETIENDFSHISAGIIELPNEKFDAHGSVQKRPSIPCELQLNTGSDINDVNLDSEMNTLATEPKRGSQQITEVINSYSDDITPARHLYSNNFPRPNTSVLIPNKSGIVLREPETSSDEDFHSPMRRFSGDAFKVPAIEETFSELMSVKNILQDMEDKTPTSEVLPRFIGPDGLTSPLSYLNGSGRRSRMSPAITERTESELDMSEQLDNVSISTDSMYADDEDDGSEMIFSKTYTEDKGGECLVSYTFYNTAHDYDSDEFWAESSAAEENYKVLENSANQASCTFRKARSEMHDIQRHLQDLRRQMEYLQDDIQGTSLTPSLSLGSSEWRHITE